MNATMWGAILLLGLIAFRGPVPPQSSGAASTQNGASTQNIATMATTISGPIQPVPFSHKQHAGALQLPCEFCHTPSRSGETLLIPQATMCMQCHQTMDTGNPGVQKLASYAKRNALIPWVRIYELPSSINFSHKVHLQHGSTCVQCHGNVAEQVSVYKVADLSMANCIRCHQAKKAKVDCVTCHSFQE